MKSSKWLLLLVAAAACGGPSKPAETAPKGRQIAAEDTVLVLNAAGTDTLHRLPVALADSETERNSGLMDVFSFGNAAGMFFVFDTEEPQTFWMANTPLSLDMVFIASNGTIVRIHSDTQPYSNTTYASVAPARYVLELPAGWSAENGLVEGMKIIRSRP